MIEGAVNHIASRRFEFGGIDLTNFLAQELGKSNPRVNINISDVEKIKQLYSCCAEDELAYQQTQDSCPVETHTLPDGQACLFVSDVFYSMFFHLLIPVSDIFGQFFNQVCFTLDLTILVRMESKIERWVEELFVLGLKLKRRVQPRRLVH